MPFAQLLIDQGHTILHSTRHSQIEYGKDVVSLDKSGALCAYQLKTVYGKKLKKRELQKMLPQLTELVSLKFEHPSVTTTGWHKSFLVINGELEEEASELLNKFNRGNIERGNPERQLVTIGKGKLLSDALKISGKLFPTELTNIKLLLELYLEEGTHMFPKNKLAELMANCLPMLLGLNRKVNVSKCRSAISSLPLINSIAASSFSKCNNFYAELEAWVICWSYIAALAEKHGLEEKNWSMTLELIEQRILLLLELLVKDLEAEHDAVLGDAITEPFFYKARITLICSLVSAYVIWKHLKDKDDESHIDFCRLFLLDNHKRSQLWGEAAVPQFICQYWYLKSIDSSPAPDFMLGSVLDAICRLNRFGATQALPNPYYDFERVILAQAEVPGSEINDSFAGESYTGEALLHLFVRLNWKQNARLMWPSYTRVRNRYIDFEELWHTYLWRVEGLGANRSVWPKRTKQWDELRSEADEAAGQHIPELLKTHPHLFLLFLIVYPHRCTSESVRWLDTYLRENLW